MAVWNRGGPDAGKVRLAWMKLSAMSSCVRLFDLSVLGLSFTSGWSGRFVQCPLLDPQTSPHG